MLSEQGHDEVSELLREAKGIVASRSVLISISVELILTNTQCQIEVSISKLPPDFVINHVF